MRIVVVGGGGREHALGWKLARSPQVSALIGAPGNAGWAGLGEQWGDVDPADRDAFVARCRDQRIDLVVIGPEAPLVAGLADALRAAGILAFGPGARSAVLEGSKIAAKEFMRRHGVPTPEFAVMDDAARARAWVREHGAPVVVKADGLAAGKGVVVAATTAAAEAAIDQMLEARAFGAAGARIVLEQCLVGEEVSVLALTDGRSLVPLLPAQDHKRAFDHDQGPNTGGMGAYVPTTVVSDVAAERIRSEVLDRTLAGLRNDGLDDYRGVLYCGVMLVDDRPFVLEYNVRFGDPECQALLVQMAGDLLPLLVATARGELAQAAPPTWREGTTVSVVMASGGYPGPSLTGIAIPGLDRDWGPDVAVFQAGTRRDPAGATVTAGGRVLNVTAHGADIVAARAAAARAAAALRWPGAHWRQDIGSREVERQLARRS